MQTSKKNVVFRRSPYPTVQEMQPFINSHERITHGHVDSKSAVELNPLSSLVPVNADALRMGTEYRDALPPMLLGKIEASRKFFLNEMAPFLLGCANGLQDAQDVLRVALQEDTDVQGWFRKIEVSLDLAMTVKIMNFSKKFAGLDAQEEKQFMTLAFANELKTNEDMATKLLAMIKAQDTKAAAKRPAKEVVAKPEVKVPAKPAAKKAAAKITTKK